MKALIITMALTCSLAAIGQISGSVIPEKGDNVIEIQTNKPSEVNFMDFGRHLVENGYTFESKDKDFLLLVTAPKKSAYGFPIYFRKQ